MILSFSDGFKECFFMGMLKSLKSLKRLKSLMDTSDLRPPGRAEAYAKAAVFSPLNSDFGRPGDCIRTQLRILPHTVYCSPFTDLLQIRDLIFRDQSRINEPGKSTRILCKEDAIVGLRIKTV